MVRKLEDLRATPDEVLIREHDEIAVHTSVGTGYYMEELTRRDQQRAIQASQKLATASFWLTVANLLVAVVAVAIALRA